MALVSTNPATGETLAHYPVMSAAEVQEAIAEAHAAFEVWRTWPVRRRAEPMRRAALLLRDEVAAQARLISEEMGKPIKQARAEVEKCAWVCDYYAEHAEALLAPQRVQTDAYKSFVSYRPLGVVLAVMPWNFPLWQTFRFAAPSLMAGNGALLKHAPNVTGCALATEALLRRAGFPEGLFRALRIEVDQVEGVLDHPHVVAATLTGSTRAGAAVAALAGARLKKTVLELGGSDPYVILEDAELELAVEACAVGRLQNSGQSCIAAKRFIVVAPLVERFTERLVARFRACCMGDPRDEATELGPQAREDLREALHRQVTRSVEAGAELLLGGTLPEGPGYFYPATVLGGVRPGMPAFDEETFGPVAAIVRAEDEEEAIALANRSPYGLGAAVFTRDRSRGERIAEERLEAGSCFVNAFVRSDPRLPFGGIKRSGYGRELAAFGIHEFVNVKTVYVA
ncbi:NAD-dependent succinate-semialdehyde dehydrogenase [Truepera radiovictrix]|uniref:Aldehyde Dehydrogenase n=1 Tax=Truepera radiovictrix (strain DSM 17093 / CIP 108686 / LMG 22925 / RQ-24) TaxID=649638 RepID=D7CXF5_TRURR|nr:NAD-dependent succinate-semialdehyde dehydrogenase [Truepera radiovictrix]ADI13279.1 Aldehyde Dehydrogenase [Truepera radiovictrix DSM 17093]WMT58157.1 NAD-dependent succinate-semialdehyde dehydrogenase [Truepera radiovictrix]